MNRETAIAVGRIAKAERIDLAKLLAVVEVESSGAPFEAADASWPRFLFERHHFYKHLSGAARDRAVREGLAHDGWRRSTQYRDLNTSAKRIAVLKRAIAIDVEAALKSCSWGIGQVMGSNHRLAGYPSAQAMVEGNRTLDGQVRSMVGFIKGNGLLDELGRGDWAGFARGYNGPGYAQNGYHTKLAAAHRKWQASVAEIEAAVRSAPNPAVAAAQASDEAARRPSVTGVEAVAGASGAVAAGGGVAAAQPHWIVPALILLALVTLGAFVVASRLRKARAETEAAAAIAVSAHINEPELTGASAK